MAAKKKATTKKTPRFTFDLHTITYVQVKKLLPKLSKDERTYLVVEVKMAMLEVRALMEKMDKKVWSGKDLTAAEEKKHNVLRKHYFRLMHVEQHLRGYKYTPMD
jgi:hypothetical protein